MHQELVGAIAIGRPGTTVTTHQQMDAEVTESLARFEAGRPWMIQASTTLIGQLLASGVTYPFDTYQELFTWARIRVVTQDMLTAVKALPAQGGTNGQKRWRAIYRALERQRSLFQQAGDAQQPFTLLDRTYTVRSVPNTRNHYYAERNSQVITYQGRLTVRAAQNITNCLAGGPTASPGAVNDGPLDEFVCAFLAEPTRWEEEHIFNILAIMSKDLDAVLTENIGTILLPMAAGSTWEPQLNQLGAQAPRRIVGFATARGMTDVINQEVTTAVDLNAFKTSMRSQYDLS